MSLRLCQSASVLAVLLSASAAMSQTASLSPTGYSENFDSMGTSGTTPPNGWRVFTANFGSNATWTNATGIPASGTNSMASTPATTASSALAVATTPAAANNNGYNAAASAGNTSDRVIATAPTGIAGNIVQLQISNDTGADLSGGTQLAINFDTIRYSVASTANELPGYWVFVSFNGTTWTNVTPNPTITTVPNSAGTTQSSLTYTLTAPWTAGTTAYIRFVDDNAAQTSPDQFIALNNVVISSTGGNPNGKCCFADGSCIEVTTGSCATGGVFASGGVCTPNTCPQPPQGSCCALDGSCTVTIQAACTATWTSAGTCTPNTCPVLVVGLSAAGYSQNFDAMGTSGTTLPGGWQCRFLSGSHDTFSYAGSLSTITTTFTPASTPTAINNGTGSSTLATNNTLIAVTDPTTQASGSQCYNIGLSASSADRCLGSSPTGNAACELQLSLRNDTGAVLNALTVSYDIRRFRTTTNNNTAYNASPYVGVEEFPGYQLFVSTDSGATFSNISDLNPVLSGAGIVVANSVGVTNIPVSSFALPTSVAAGGTIVLRWVDDNAQSPSPDQLIGLDNLLVTSADPAELGACCAADGSCTLALGDDSCTGRIFQGPGTTCSPNQCPQPPSGSCCLTDGSCSITTQFACATLWTEAGVCVPNTCPGPVIACCAADGSCSLVPQAACSGFAISNATCTTALCRQPGTTRFCVFGDYGIDGANQAAVASRMKTYNPQFLVTTGDNTYSTSTNISNYDNTQSKYYNEFIQLGNPASTTTYGPGAAVNKFFPVMGNHDMDIGGGAATSIPYWNAYWVLPGNERYYTFSMGPVDFFMLSSDPREPDSNAFGGTQSNWFTSAYNASTAAYKIVVFHHPAQTSVSGHGPDNTMRGWNFQNLPGITAVMSGHNHNMERLEFGGIPWFVSGAGGNSLYTISSIDPSSVFRNDTQWGFLLVDANSSGITFRFINTAGQILDTRFVAAPPMPGACCNSTSCTIATTATCTGAFQGSGTACGSPANPTTCCKANFNATNGVTVQDLFDFLAAWFNGSASADINGVNGVSVQDIFDFLGIWFAGC